MVIVCGMGIALWPSMTFDLEGTEKIALDGPWGLIEIADAETIAHIVDDLEGVRFRKTLVKDGHILDNYDIYRLSFYDTEHALITETGYLFVDGGQACIIDADWCLWRSMHGVDVLFYENLFSYTE